MDAPLEFDEAEQLYNDEVLNTRRELQESCINLEQLARYCERSYVTNQDQQVTYHNNNNKIEFYTAQQLYDKIKLVSNINPTYLLLCKVLFQSVQRKKYYSLQLLLDT